MYLNDNLLKNIQNSITTTVINPEITSTTESFEDDNDMTRTISYAIPLSCFAIIIVLLIAVVIHRRHRIFEKWSSVKLMKNTDPRLYERSGLRRDSEYESDDDNLVNVAIVNDDSQKSTEPKCHLATIT